MFLATQVDHLANIYYAAYIIIFYILIIAISLVFSACIMIYVGKWIYEDSKKLNIPDSTLWTVLCIFTWIAIIVYFQTVRKTALSQSPSTPFCERCGSPRNIDAKFCTTCQNSFVPQVSDGKSFAKNIIIAYSLYLVCIFVLVFLLTIALI